MSSVAECGACGGIGMHYPECSCPSAARVTTRRETSGRGDVRRLVREWWVGGGRYADAEGARQRVEAALSEYGHYPEVGVDAEAVIEAERAVGR